MLPSALILVIDRFGAGFLGPYGNTWVDTQSCNRLASQSLLCEFAISDSPNLETVYRSYWTGRHAMDTRPADSNLPEIAAGRGLKTVLLTDERLVAEHPLATGFEEIILLPETEALSPAGEIEETQFARLTQAAMEVLARQREPYLFWVHSRGMAGPWDAPLKYRHAFRDEDDPLPGEFTSPPLLQKPGSFDPDELLRYVHAYAGQVTALDLCLDALLDAVDEHPLAENTLFSLTSPRGYPLGEHGQVGPVENALYGELLNVPFLVRLPRKNREHMRTHELVQPGDLHDLLWSQLAGGHSSHLLDITAGRDRAAKNLACAVSQHERAIRTPAWFLRELPGPEGTKLELFAKPDDRWEVNEVSSRATDVAQELLKALDAFQAAARNGTLSTLSPLPESLGDEWR